MHPCIIQELTVDMAHFMERVAEFDRRLATILNHTFQDCSGCEAAFKVWVSILMVYIQLALYIIHNNYIDCIYMYNNICTLHVHVYVCNLHV